MTVIDRVKKVNIRVVQCCSKAFEGVYRIGRVESKGNYEAIQETEKAKVVVTKIEALSEDKLVYASEGMRCKERKKGNVRMLPEVVVCSDIQRGYDAILAKEETGRKPSTQKIAWAQQVLAPLLRRRRCGLNAKRLWLTHKQQKSQWAQLKLSYCLACFVDFCRVSCLPGKSPSLPRSLV